MIENCFMDQQPNFYVTVEVDGNQIAKIHALTENDYAAINDYAIRQRMINGQLEIDINSKKMNIIKIYRSLTGESESGWELGKDITMDNIGKLIPKYRNAILNAINDLEEKNKITEDIVKN